MSFTPAIKIGCRIASAHQYGASAEKAARIDLTAGFKPISLTEIASFTVPANELSWRLMQKLDMGPTGTFEHPRRPYLLYCLSNSSYSEQGGGVYKLSAL